VLIGTPLCGIQLCLQVVTAEAPPEPTHGDVDGGDDPAAGAGEDDAHWFLCNDSAVSVSSSAMLKGQFSGSESAYILCYVSNAHVAKVAQHPVPPAPVGIGAMVAAENAALAEARRAYETALHTCTLTVYLGHPRVWKPAKWSFCRAGLLLPSPTRGTGLPVCVTVTVDSRGTLEALYAAIKAAAGAIVPSPELVLGPSSAALLAAGSDVRFDVAEPAPSTATSTTLLDHFSRMSQLHPAQDALGATPYGAPMAIGCRLVLGI